MTELKKLDDKELTSKMMGEGELKKVLLSWLYIYYAQYDS